MIRTVGATHDPGSTVQCTHISIPQASKTLGCVLSRPSWLWGCEMGANESGVVGGNEAVHSLLSHELGDAPRLLGMDLLRLALERGSTAREAMEVCIDLLETHGQGGPCEEGGDWTYENGFLFADGKEAYVLETAGVKHWACEHVEGSGKFRNISNGLSIRSNWSALSGEIRSVAQRKGWWDGSSEFDWKRSLSAGGRSHVNLAVCGREAAGLKHLESMKRNSKEMNPPCRSWWVKQMALVLRDEYSGICFRDMYGFCSTGSQISWLPSNLEADASHFFTGASDPLCGTPYKHFSFRDPFAQSDEKVLNDHGTGRLWQVWRKIALNNRSISQKQKTELADMENHAMKSLDRGSSEKSFAECVQREIELMKET